MTRPTLYALALVLPFLAVLIDEAGSQHNAATFIAMEAME